MTGTPQEFTLPDSRFGMTRVEYNLGALPTAVPQQDILLAANKLNAHRYLKLTHKQRVFVDAYLGNDFDTTIAAREAGFSEEEAPRVGRKLMKRPEIKEAVDLALAYYRESNVLRFERLVEELQAIALTNITDLIDPETVEMRADVTDDDPRWRAVKSLKRTETKYGTNREVVMHDKMAAIDKLLRILAPSQGEPDPDGTERGTAAPNVSVNVAIVSVPSGQFVPAPPSPYATGNEQQVRTIEHQGSAGPVLQTGPSIASRAAVP